MARSRIQIGRVSLWSVRPEPTVPGAYWILNSGVWYLALRAEGYWYVAGLHMRLEWSYFKDVQRIVPLKDPRKKGDR